MNNLTALFALISTLPLSDAFSLHRRMPQQVVINQRYHSPNIIMPMIERTLMGSTHSYYDGKLLLSTPLAMTRQDENDTIEEETSNTKLKIPLVAKVESFFDAMLGQLFSFVQHIMLGTSI